MIGFDNAIELAITTYLSLHPIQRGGQTYKNEDVEKWSNNYHTKADFFFLVPTNSSPRYMFTSLTPRARPQNNSANLRHQVLECKSRGVVPNAKQDEVVWFHAVRSGQYHAGGSTVPNQRVLSGVRAVALEVFSVLFDQKDASLLLEEHIAMMSPSPSPPRTDAHDRLIDQAHDMIGVCGRVEYASELLYALDPARYREVALELETSVDAPNEEWEGGFE